MTPFSILSILCFFCGWATLFSSPYLAVTFPYLQDTHRPELLSSSASFLAPLSDEGSPLGGLKLFLFPVRGFPRFGHPLPFLVHGSSGCDHRAGPSRNFCPLSSFSFLRQASFDKISFFSSACPNMLSVALNGNDFFQVCSLSFVSADSVPSSTVSPHYHPLHPPPPQPHYRCFCFEGDSSVLCGQRYPRCRVFFLVQCNCGLERAPSPPGPTTFPFDALPLTPCLSRPITLMTTVLRRWSCGDYH